MREVNRQHQRAAWLLLILYAPLLLTISTHIHTDAAVQTACEDCLHHACHEIHFSQNSFTWDDCVLCQLHSAPYLAPTVISFTYYAHCCNMQAVIPVDTIATRIVSLHPTRAPPYTF